MGAENLAYALTQVVHNFGAAAVLVLFVAGLWLLSGVEVCATCHKHVKIGV